MLMNDIAYHDTKMHHLAAIKAAGILDLAKTVMHGATSVERPV